ncbi:MAG TPA: glycosyltransferase family 2 protein [Dehalococcoidia bacterium]|nr:glycosyltransferase family 2 protein [Dehalococcoidia bacterium]
MTKSDITIIIPAYNEEEGIVDLLEGLKKLPDRYEILIVDDGSTDSTRERVASAGIRVISHPYNKGYGAAIKTGIQNAETDIILSMDADGQHTPDDIEKLVQHIDNYDMVVGARTKNTKVPLLRKLAKMILNLTVRYLAGTRIPDLNSGFRVLKRSIAMEFLHILPNGFSFTTTITLACLKSGYNIKYVPVDAMERVGSSKIRPFKDGFNFVLLIIKTIALFDALKVFLPISVLLLFLGLVDLLYELIVYFNISSTSILLIVSGLLIFFFGLLADQIASIRREMK